MAARGAIAPNTGCADTLAHYPHERSEARSAIAWHISRMTGKTGNELVEEARTRIREAGAAEVKAMMGRGDAAVYLDVREPSEWNLGHLPKAVHLPRGNLESRIEGIAARDATIVVYCARGNRSALAADTLRVMGYRDVISLAGGWADWMAADGPVEG
jgi:rhodanese-related sulfurtransferase